MVNISILGSTGSIGKQTLDIVRNNKGIFKVCVLAANSNMELLYEQAKEFKPDIVAIADKSKYFELKELLGNEITVLAGEEGVIEAASYNEAEIIVSAIVGIAGLKPTYHSISKGKRIALANKETLVTAGNIIMEKANSSSASIIPVDSEHSAIFQSKKGHNNEISRIILTASGGPFRTKTKEEIEEVKVTDALNHPNWSMGKKVTIDSATLMNKGLEVIEAKWLFNMPINKIEVLIHPQSIIHSMVEFIDGSIIAQLGVPDMRTPIQYALTYPDRISAPCERLNLSRLKQLTFEEPDYDRFPCLKLAYDALNLGDSTCIVLNGANEVAVNYFLQGKIKFTDIYKLVYDVLESHKNTVINSLDDVLSIDDWSKKKTSEMLKKRWM